MLTLAANSYLRKNNRFRIGQMFNNEIFLKEKMGELEKQTEFKRIFIRYSFQVGCCHHLKIIRLPGTSLK